VSTKFKKKTSQYQIYLQSTHVFQKSFHSLRQTGTSWAISNSTPHGSRRANNPRNLCHKIQFRLCHLAAVRIIRNALSMAVTRSGQTTGGTLIQDNKDHGHPTRSFSLETLRY